MENKKISVFGASLPKEGDKDYTDGLLIGEMLANAGYSVITGGYIGLMEAVSKGAYLAGGHVIGVTCDEIEVWRPVKHNPWVIEEQRRSTLQLRLDALIELCDAAIALPGGIGTLAEIMTLWSRLQIESTSPKPMVLVGKAWKDTFETFIQGQRKYIEEKYTRQISYADTPQGAVTLLEDWFNQ
ncbi:MAG: LOG family protein [Anaerolineales bacterium]|nr:LOG family protein [Anaerolineales bacterium]